MGLTDDEKFSTEVADPGTILEDIARLYQIVEAKGIYLRGITPNALAAISAIKEKKKAQK